MTFPLLVNHFVRKFSLQMNKKITRVCSGSDELVAAAAAGRAMSVNSKTRWSGRWWWRRNRRFGSQDFVFKANTVPNGAAEESRRDREGIYSSHARNHNWNQTRAAEILGIDRVTLHHKLKRYGWSKRTVEAR